MAPAAMPPMMRARKMSGNEVASARARYDRQDPSKPSRMIGLRPILSDQRPQIGENRNCINEKLVPSRPMVNADAPNDSA